MNAYKSATPRAAFAFAAFAMTALTAVISVLVPASIDSRASRSDALARASVPVVATAAASEFERADVLVVTASSSNAKAAKSTSLAGPVRCPATA